MDTSTYQGRQLLLKEIPKNFHTWLSDHPELIIRKALIENKRYVICQRCGSQTSKLEAQLSKNIYFCPVCIQLKRVDSYEYLWSLPVVKIPCRQVTYCFEGKLTQKQKCVSDELVQAYYQKKMHLVHAVTGAGKTEMLFELIYHVLKDGGRVGIAAPRVDVCLELFPRLQKVFPNERIDLLYGEATVGFTGAHFIICTTHQLLRFYQFFDVLIIDEVDAFPFATSEYLQHGATYALQSDGQFVYMTATSSDMVQKEVMQSGGSCSLVSRRFHGKDLPVPKSHYIAHLSKKINKRKCPYFIKKLLFKQSQHLLIFFPNITMMKVFYQSLKKIYPNKKIAYVYAGKEDREVIILKMREGYWDVLLTTTILERGVTFSNISVIVMCANHRVYNKASLIQIAGRVGRDKNYPTGYVLFIHEGQTTCMKQAIEEIKKRNKE